MLTKDVKVDVALDQQKAAAIEAGSKQSVETLALAAAVAMQNEFGASTGKADEEPTLVAPQFAERQRRRALRDVEAERLHQQTGITTTSSSRNYTDVTDGGWGASQDPDTTALLEILPRVVDRLNAALRKHGVKTQLTPVTVLNNFLIEGGIIYMRDGVASGPMDGYKALGADVLVSRWAEFKEYLPDNLNQQIASGAGVTENENELGHSTKTIDKLDLESGLSANAGMLAAFTAQLEREMRQYGGRELSSLPLEGQQFWLAIYFNTTQTNRNNGIRMLKLHGPDWYKQAWKQSDDYALYNWNGQFNALSRMTTASLAGFGEGAPDPKTGMPFAALTKQATKVSELLAWEQSEQTAFFAELRTGSLPLLERYRDYETLLNLLIDGATADQTVITDAAVLAGLRHRKEQVKNLNRFYQFRQNQLAMLTYTDPKAFIDKATGQLFVDGRSAPISDGMRHGLDELHAVYARVGLTVPAFNLLSPNETFAEADKLEAACAAKYAAGTEPDGVSDVLRALVAIRDNCKPWFPMPE